jgi:serine/threonine protein kinase/tetratricopeptide (TPR) repeat protein
VLRLGLRNVGFPGGELPEQIISHYRLIREIGSGGMGIVHKAEDLTLGRHVALKLLPGTKSDFSALERFRQEARAASALNHPAICTIYEIGEDKGQHFISMELLEGEPLNLRILRQPFEIDEALEFAMQITDGLDAAHLKGIIHRDLKPANLFVTKRGHGKILDFGLAKLVGDEPGSPDAPTLAAPLTRPHAAVGTREYMSPEQARGSFIDARSDIFSLGEVFYEMVTGRRPFAGETAALLFDAILNSDPEPPSRFNPSLPRRWEEIILGMLEKDPDLRFQSAAAVCTELKRLKRDMDLGRAEPASGTHTHPSSPVRARPSSKSRTRTDTGLRTARPRRKGIAVLPFVNATGNADLEYLSDGLTELLINSLSGIPELRTIPRAVVFHYKGQPFDPAKIAKDLKVRLVVAGRLSQRAGNLTIGVELLELGALSQLWGHQYNAGEAEVAGLSGSIASDITQTLRLNLTSDISTRLSRRHTSTPQAFELYLKGRHAYARFTPEHVYQAIEYARQAIQLDPMFASAYALAADGYSLCGYFRYGQLDDVFPKAKAAALKAIDLDPTLGEPHAALGLIYYIYEWDWPRAEQAFRRAAQFQAEGLGGGTSYAFLMLTQGRLDQAIALAERALQVDPLSAPVAAALAWIYFSAREFDKAARQARNARELDPRIFDNPELFPTDIMVDIHSGRAAEALGKYQAFLQESKIDIAKSGLPYVMAHAGHKDEVRMMLQMADLSTADPTNVAMVYAALGDYDLAFDWLEKGLQGRFRGMFWLKSMPDFDPMRKDQRYFDILRRMNLPD